VGGCVGSGLAGKDCGVKSSRRLTYSVATGFGELRCDVAHRLAENYVAPRRERTEGGARVQRQGRVK